MVGETSGPDTEAAAAAAAALAAQVAASSSQDRPNPSTSLSHSIDKLDGTMATGQSNYNAWRFHLVRILKEKILLSIVTEGSGSTPASEDSAASAAAGKKPDSAPELAEFHQKDNQAFTIITLNIKDSQIPHIQRCNTTKGAWDALRQVHQGIGVNGRMVLTKRLWALHLREGDDMASHLNAFRHIMNQIENLSSDEGTSQIQGVDLVSMLSLSLPDSFEPLVMALQSRSEVLTFDFMAGQLLQESTHRQASMATNSKPSANQSAFFTGASGRFSGRGRGLRGGARGHAMRARGRGRSSFGVVDLGHLRGAGEGRGAAKKMIGRCPGHYCQREGHWRAKCLKWKEGEAGNRFKREGGGQTAFMATIAKRKASEDWIIDSGTSQHISAQREQFQNYKNISPVRIQIGDGSEIEAIGMGNIPLETESNLITLRDVLYTPTIGGNLLSVAKVIDHGHSLLFTSSECQTQNTEGRVRGIRERNIYVLRAKKVALAALTNMDVAVNAQTWHRRLGH